jgi:dTDP-4-amino-4,6-dideoxygalactose transaminase
MINKLFYFIIGLFKSGEDRTQKLKRNVAWSTIIKFGQILIELVKVPILLTYLDTEKYGVWLTIVSILMWTHNFDLGLGSGLRYKLTESIAQDNDSRGRGLVSTAYFSMGLIMLLVFIVVAPILSSLNWNSILNVHTIENSELIITIVSIFLVFAVQFVLELISVVLKADQRAAISDVFKPVGSVISLLVIISLKFFSSNSLLYASLAMSVPFAVVLFIANMYYLSKDYSRFRPSFKFFDKKLLKDIYSLGVKYFLGQFAALVNCIRYVGGIPVFCDIESPEHINIDPIDIEKKITTKTKAIIVVHMAGFPAHMDEIMAIAKKYNLKVIEDACHGPLSEYKGKKLGTIGDVGCFSFFSNKNISTGEGGMLITNNEEMAKKARLLRSHGMTTMSYQRASGHATSYDIVELGYNFRMDDIRASIGVVQMKKLYNDLEKRIQVRNEYLKQLSYIDGITIPFENNTEFVSNYIMSIVLKDSTSEKRDLIRDKLHKEGIQTSVHYPAIHKFSIYKEYNAKLPVTEYVTDNEITLPMYASLSNADIELIVNTLKVAVSG